MTSILCQTHHTQGLEGQLQRMKCAVLTDSTSSGALECIHTSLKHYQKGRKYNFLQIPCLIRILGKKFNLFTKDLLLELQSNSDEVAVILEWNEKEKVVLIIDAHDKEIQQLGKLLLQQGPILSTKPSPQERRRVNRYDIWALAATLDFPIGESSQFRVKNVSLCGLQISSQSKLSLNHFHQVKLQMNGRKPFSLNLKQLWQIKAEDPQGSLKYKSGYQLKFFQKENFDLWLRLLYAFDRIHAKNIL